MEHIFLNPLHPGSFGGVKRLKSHTKFSSKKVKDFLETQYCYVRHKQRRDKFKRRKVEVHESNYLWQADIVFLKRLRIYNDNMSYLLTVIDCFSRYAYAIPIKNKTSKEVIRAFAEIFKMSKATPKFLQCDQGKEFFSKVCGNYFESNNITLYHNYSDFKACVVERFHKTLLNRLSKWMSHTGNQRYIEVLPKLLKSYNNSVHSSIGMKPKEVSKNNEMEAWLHDHRKHIGSHSKQKFTVHYVVHILNRKSTFQKGYMPTYTQELFVVCDVLNTHPICYRIKDMSNNRIEGIFYNEELQKARSSS